MNEDQQTELDARFTLHEFLLEHLYANVLAIAPREQAQQLKDGLAQAFGKGTAL